VILIDRKYVFVHWRTGSPRPDGRTHRLRLNRDVHNVYLHLRRLEIVVWYR
jgi:hypothetical protein